MRNRNHRMRAFAVVAGLSLAAWGAGCGGSGLVQIADLPEAGTEPDQGESRGSTPSGGTGDPGAAPGASGETGKDAGVANGPPVLTLSVSPAQITVGQSVTFRAEVTDPRGPANVGTGVLQDEQGVAYGSFAASVASGFTLTLTWAELNQIRTIAFPAPSAPRNFVALFKNLQGKTGSGPASLSLACGDAHSGACAGVCVDLSSKDNCGTCGTKCKSGGTCRDGSCSYPTWSACAPRGVSFTLTCAQQCQAAGKACATGCDTCAQGQDCDAESFSDNLDCSIGSPTIANGACSDFLPTNSGGSFRCCCM